MKTCNTGRTSVRGKLRGKTGRSEWVNCEKSKKKIVGRFKMTQQFFDQKSRGDQGERIRG